MEALIPYLWAFGIVGLIYVFVKNAWVSKQEVGNEKMARIAKNIADALGLETTLNHLNY